MLFSFRKKDFKVGDVVRVKSSEDDFHYLDDGEGVVLSLRGNSFLIEGEEKLTGFRIKQFVPKEEVKKVSFLRKIKKRLRFR